jgi:hypothetical protein
MNSFINGRMIVTIQVRQDLHHHKLCILCSKEQEEITTSQDNTERDQGYVIE